MHHSDDELDIDSIEIESIKKAAEGGDLDALFKLGGMYQEGISVPRDETKAFEIFNQLAEQQHSKGILWAGICYHRGEGVEQNNPEAERLFRLVAHELEEAREQLDAMYDYKDIDFAPEGIEVYFQDAYELKCSAAKEYLISLTQEYSQAAFNFFNQRALQEPDNLLIKYWQGECYFSKTPGFINKVERDKAEALFREAVQGGITDAQNVLDELYRDDLIELSLERQQIYYQDFVVNNCRAAWKYLKNIAEENPSNYLTRHLWHKADCIVRCKDNPLKFFAVMEKDREFFGSGWDKYLFNQLNSASEPLTPELETLKQRVAAKITGKQPAAVSCVKEIQVDKFFWKQHVSHKEAERKICDEHPDVCVEVLLQDSECFVEWFDYLLESCVEKLSAKGRIELCWHFYAEGRVADEKAQRIIDILESIAEELQEADALELQTKRYEMLHALTFQLEGSESEKTKAYGKKFGELMSKEAVAPELFQEATPAEMMGAQGFFPSRDDGEKEPENKRAKSSPRSPG